MTQYIDNDCIMGEGISADILFVALYIASLTKATSLVSPSRIILGRAQEAY